MKRFIIAVLTLLLVACTSTAGAGAQSSKKVLFLGTSTTVGIGAWPTTSRYVDLVKAARPTNTYTEISRSGVPLVHSDPTLSWEQVVIPTGNDIVIMQLGT